MYVALDTNYDGTSADIFVAADCTACGKFENGLQGGLTLGASIGASLKQKVLSKEDVLFGVTFAVS